LLKVSNVFAGYGKMGVLFDISFTVGSGEFVALLGQNGAGKTTTLKTIANVVKPTAGTIEYQGKRISDCLPQEMAGHGVSFVTDGGNLFSGMTVMENIKMGAYSVRDKAASEKNLKLVFELFPRLEERKRQLAETLSGGERKMLAIARGLMSNPSLMLVDEPSLGLAPKLVMDVFMVLKDLSKRGVSILLVEQNVNTTLKVVDRAYVLDLGTISIEGKAEELRDNPTIRQAYLGME
jgi:branched-chain amino acid transport system ATP-binding protein